MNKKYFINNKYFIDKDIIIEKNTCCKTRVHTHNFIELVYIFRGKIIHTIDDAEYPTSKGDMLVINYNQQHSFNGSSDALYYNLLIKPEFINNSQNAREDFFALLDLKNYEDFKNLIDRNNSVIKFSPDERITVENLLVLLENELSTNHSGYYTVAYSAVNIILTMILRRMSVESKNAENNMREVLSYIKENYNEYISVAKLASLTHYNSSYFSRMFKIHTGVTFTEYLKKTRIEAACNLLMNTDLKVSDIYVKVGYTDKTKFHKHFQQITGMTPLAFKKSKN